MKNGILNIIIKPYYLLKIMKSNYILLLTLILIFSGCNIPDKKQSNEEKESRGLPSLNLAERIQPVLSESLYQDEGWFTWGGSMVQGDDGKYYLFYSRWPYETEFESWLMKSEIACAVADNPTGPYKFHSEVLKGRGNGFFDADMVHNPHIHKFNGKYYLYYIGATTKSERQITRRTQRIGVAISESIDGPWQRLNKPILDVTPGSFDSGFTTNPSVVRKNDSTYVMVYKCMDDNREVVHGVAFSKSPTGPFEKHSKPIFTKEGSKFPAEDPFIFQYRNKLYTILSDNHGEFTGIKQALCLFTSDDGIDWKLAEHPLVSDRKILWKDGAIEELKDLERPQIWFDNNNEPAVLFCAATRGKRAPGNNFNIQIPLQ